MRKIRTDFLLRMSDRFWRVFFYFLDVWLQRMLERKWTQLDGSFALYTGYDALKLLCVCNNDMQRHPNWTRQHRPT